MLAIEYFDRAIAHHPDGIAVIDAKLAYSYREPSQLRKGLGPIEPLRYGIRAVAGAG